MPITTCGICIETQSDCLDLDIAFQSEFDSMATGNESKGLKMEEPGQDSEAAQVMLEKSRGNRKPGEIVVETYTQGDGTWADMVSASLPTKKSSKTPSKESTPFSKESSRRSTKESTPASFDDKSDHLNFISGNPFVEVTKGIIHLFKDKQDDVVTSEMMCMIGVPAKHKTHDLLQFTAPCHADLEYMRIIHDHSPNFYMVLLKFRSPASAAEFYSAYNGLPYNSLEPELCSLLPVSWVETCKDSEYHPANAERELPYCTICLERMDESVSTVLTILCNHKFHSDCLAQWEDATCPVCRYVQTPEVVTEQVCSDCESAADLWICLVCGYVGCGRYAGGHAHQHFMDTQHCYSMELGHNRVWDYVGDNFVHRLVQNTSDGKLVEQTPDRGEGKHGGANLENAEKVDSLQLEYTYLLTSQLEDQRRYFESKLSRVEEEARREIEEVAARARVAQKELEELQGVVAGSTREKTKVETKVTNLSTRLNKMTAELSEEKQLNESLRKNQADWQNKLKRSDVEISLIKEVKDREVGELKEQVRDLMFYLESQATVGASPLKEEIQEGSIVVTEGLETPKKAGKGGKKKRN